MIDNTLVFIDWDDTLFPTSWIVDNRIDLNKTEYRSKYIILFSELDNVLYDFLKKVTKYGKVIIVTNASMSWIKTSLKILPNSSKFILKNIKIVSARDMYGKHKDVFKWKQFAFEKEVNSFFKKKSDVHNLISIGDADYEHTALINFDDWEKMKPHKRCLKTIRFMTSPTYYSVVDQIQVLTRCITKVCRKHKHIDLLFRTKN